MLASLILLWATFLHPAWLATMQEAAGCAEGLGTPTFQEQSWDKIQYLGGAIDVPSIPRNWANSLTISCRGIRLKTATGRLVEFSPKNIISVAYAKGKYGERVGLARTALAVGVMSPIAGVVLAAISSKGGTHFIGIEYKLEDGRTTGVLLRADKTNYDAILGALRSVAGLVDVPAGTSQQQTDQQNRDQKKPPSR